MNNILFRFNKQIITGLIRTSKTMTSTWSREILSGAKRDEILKPLLEKGWNVLDSRDALHKEFKFKNFNQAFGFMTRLAMFAEKHDHHPEWSNVYNVVSITLTTHSSKGITEYDARFALFAEMIQSQTAH